MTPQEIVNKTSNEKWEQYSEIFLSTTGTNGKALEVETLTNIKNESTATCDKNTIMAVARHDNADWDPTNPAREIKLYMLQHRMRYDANYLEGSDERCNTSSSTFIGLAQNVGLQEVVDPTPTNPGYENIGTVEQPVYYVAEHGKLFGTGSPYRFVYSISTAACIFNGETGNIEGYGGYFFEGGGDIPNITDGQYKSRMLKSYVYTPGGGPLTATNWILKVVESQTSEVDEDISDGNKRFCYLSGDDLRIITKTYIHFFAPNGVYVRRSIDRTDMAEGKIHPGDLTVWYYQDFANEAAVNAGQNFKTIWNNCYSGNMKQMGRPNNEDFSLFWDHGIPDGFNVGRAIHPSQPTWYGKEVI